MNANTISRIRRSAILLLQGILLFAFGCGPGPTPIVIISSTPPVSPAPTGTTPEPELPTPSAQAPTGTPFVPTATIKIFSNVPLSGDQEAWGQDIWRGTELAIYQLSGPLNEYGYQVEIITYDDQNRVETALANAQAIAADPQVLCGVGHYDSDITIAASDIYHMAQLPFVAPSATGVLLTDRSYREVNRVVGHHEGQGLAAAQFVQAQGYRSIYIISREAENSLRNAEHFRTTTGSLGVQWLGSAVTNRTDETMVNRTASLVVNANPDLVYITGSAEEAIPFLLALRAAGYMGAFLGTDQLDNPVALGAAGPSLLEGGGLYSTITSAPSQYYPDAGRFIEEFRGRFASEPLSYAARAYDATGICLKGIEEVVRAKGGSLPARSEVATAIRALPLYQGITGTYTFNRRGDPNSVQYYVLQVTSLDLAGWAQNPVVASVEVTPP
jgi:ABC-type branched-subunit amino acid transport system substrate-binding protein